MFRLHETTRRRVCRLAFVALCALPTLATVAWIGHWHRPWRVSDAEMRLSSTLRSDVRLVDWREPRPAATQTRSAQIVVSGAAAPLVDATDVRTNQVGDVQVISIGRLVVDASRLATALERAGSWLTDRSAASVQLRADELVFEDHRVGVSYALRRVELHSVSSGSNSWKLQVVGRGGSGDDASRVLEMSCESIAGDQTPAIKATIQAGAERLPVWLLSTAWPIFHSGGSAASFAGRLEIESRGVEVVGVARGDIQNAALGDMLPTSSPCHVEGSADIALSELRWRNGQIERLTGSMRAESVRINRVLLENATRWLLFEQVRIGPMPLGAAAETIAVDALAVRFDLTRQGLSMGGDFPAEAQLPPGCVAVSGGTPLLIQPQYLLQAWRWVRFASGSEEATIPATEEALGVAARLPLPDAASERK